MSESHASVRAIAQSAFHCFAHGLATAQWEEFLVYVAEDVQFWFPAGPFQGWNRGKERLAQFLQAASLVFESGLTLTVERVTWNQETVVFEVRSQGLMRGLPYHNQAAIAFDIQQDQIHAYREYLGVIYQMPPPGSDH